MAAPVRKKWASPEDWAAHKKTIVGLYTAKELDEVMQIMERDHGFFSTRKVYKTKIKEWDVGKRLNDDDVLAILHIKAQREAVWKDSEFWLMGKRVNENNIHRYLRRKPQILTKFRRGERQDPLEAGRIRCVTPPPPPETVRRIPGVLMDTELLLADCRDYWRSSFDAGTWVVEPDGVCVSRRAGKRGGDIADNVLSKFFAAADLLSRSDFSGAFRLLDLAFSQTGQILALDVPKTLPILMLVFSRLELRGQRDTLNVFRRYLLGQAEGMAQGNNRKFQGVLQRVSALEVERYGEVLPRLFELMIEQSDAQCGPGSNLSLEVYFTLFPSFVLRQDSRGQVRSLKRELDKIPPGHPRTPWIKRHERLYVWKVSQVLRDQGRFDEALAALRAIEGTFTSEADDVDASRHWHFVAIVHRRRGDLVGAEKYHRRSLKVIVHRHDGGDVDSIQYGANVLAEVLELMGRTGEATRVRAFSQEHIAVIAAQVRWDWDEFERRTAIEPVTIPLLDEESSSATMSLPVSEHGSVSDTGT